MSTNPVLAEGGSLVDRAIRHVREHINVNDLKVGDTLPGEGHFATELGVSRAVMREAFGALAALRLIDVANGRRARVGAIDGSVMATSMSHAVATTQVSLTEVWDVRRTLELRTAQLAAANRTVAQGQGILDAAVGMRAAGDDVARLVASDILFHQRIAQACGNELFHQIIRSFEPLMRVAVPSAWDTRTTVAQREEMLDLHEAIGAAIRDGDADAAMDGTARHFDTSIGDLLRR